MEVILYQNTNKCCTYHYNIILLLRIWYGDFKELNTMQIMIMTIPEYLLNDRSLK